MFLSSREQVGDTLLGPLERANLNHWIVIEVSDVSSL
jgi:hypothetical protein